MLKNAILSRTNSYYLTESGDKCYYHVQGKHLSDVPDDYWYHGGYLYRGLRDNTFRDKVFNFEEIIKRINDDGGLMSVIFSLRDSISECGPVLQPQSNVVATAHGLTNCHHLSKSLGVATSFITEQDPPVGVLLVVKIGDHIGIDTNVASDNPWEDEDEIAMPGFIYANEIVMLVGIDNGRITKVRVNPISGLEGKFIANIIQGIITYNYKQRRRTPPTSEELDEMTTKIAENIVYGF